jgi:hypothetical protein
LHLETVYRFQGDVSIRGRSTKCWRAFSTGTTIVEVSDDGIDIRVLGRSRTVVQPNSGPAIAGPIPGYHFG